MVKLLASRCSLKVQKVLLDQVRSKCPNMYLLSN